MTQHVVVLGAGFGGLELATRLSESVPGKAQITLIDKNDAFMFGFSKLDIMFGRRPAADLWHSYRDIARPGLEFRQETITSIDAAHRRVVTNAGTYDAAPAYPGTCLSRRGPHPLHAGARGPRRRQRDLSDEGTVLMRHQPSATNTDCALGKGSSAGPALPCLGGRCGVVLA